MDGRWRPARRPADPRGGRTGGRAPRADSDASRPHRRRFAGSPAGAAQACQARKGADSACAGGPPQKGTVRCPSRDGAGRARRHGALTWRGAGRGIAGAGVRDPLEPARGGRQSWRSLEAPGPRPRQWLAEPRPRPPSWRSLGEELDTLEASARSASTGAATGPQFWGFLGLPGARCSRELPPTQPNSDGSARLAAGLALSIGTATIGSAAAWSLDQNWFSRGTTLAAGAKGQKVAHPRGVKADGGGGRVTSGQGAMCQERLGALKIWTESLAVNCRGWWCVMRTATWRAEAARLVQVLQLTLYLTLAAQQLQLWWTDVRLLGQVSCVKLHPLPRP